MFIDDNDFATIRGFFEANRPELANDPAAIRAEMHKLKEAIEEMYVEWTTNPEDSGFRNAIDVLGQGWNFLARYLGEEQVDFLAGRDLSKQAEELPDPIAEKVVAIYVSEQQQTLAAAMKQVLGLNKELRWMVYGDSERLLHAILAGRICGVIGIEMSPQARTESHLRHSLKNMPGWGYEKAEAYVMPPCTQFFPPHHFLQIVVTIKQMQEGRFGQQTDKFSLDAALPALLGHMRPLSRELRVGVIDDKPGQIAGIEKILAAWPGMKALSVIFPDMLAGPYDIVLMDEELGSAVTGGKLVETLRQRGFDKTLFASTSGGRTPPWAKQHFPGKSTVASDHEMALEFIKFVNRLIAAIDA